MVHKVNNARIVQKLEKRYNLTNVDNSPLLLKNDIQPVTNSDELLIISKGISATLAADTTGYQNALTVPSNKTYYLKSVAVFAATGTTARINSIGIYFSPATTTIYPINSFSAANSVTYVLPTRIKLQPGDIVAVNINIANAGDTFTSRCIIEEEDYYG